jgi:hypothetical protein
MLVDSEPAIAMSQGPTHCSLTKHIDFTMALASDYVQGRRAIMEHCPTAEQIADMWTKQLGPGPSVVFSGRVFSIFSHLFPLFIFPLLGLAFRVRV